MTDTESTAARERVLRAVAATRSVETPVMGSMAIAALYSTLGLHYGRGGFEDALAAVDEATLAKLLEQIAHYEPEISALSAISAPEAQREGLAAKAYPAGHDACVAWRDGGWVLVGTWATGDRPVAREGLAGRLAELSDEVERLRRALASDVRVDTILEAILTPRSDPEDGTRDHLPRRLRELLSEEAGRAGLTGFEDGYAEGYAKALALHAPSQPLPQEGGRVLDAVAAHIASCATPDSWWVVELTKHWGEGQSTLDTRRGAKAALTFIEEIKQIAAAPQPPLPSGAPDALAAGVLVEIEALEGTAAKVRNGASGDRVAAWIEMSVRGLRAAIAQADAGTSGTSERNGFQFATNTSEPWPAKHDVADAERQDALNASSPEPSQQGVEAPVILEASDTRGFAPGAFCLTLRWPDGFETTEHVSEQGAAFLGYDPEVALAQPQGAGPSERGA